MGHVAGAQGVLQARVVGPGEHVVGQAELVHSVKALHLRSLQKLQNKALDLYAAMHTIVDYLGTRHEL